MEQTTHSFRNVRTGRVTTVENDSWLLPGLQSGVEAGIYENAGGTLVEDTPSEPEEPETAPKARKRTSKARKTEEGS